MRGWAEPEDLRRRQKVGRPNRGTDISEGCLPMPAGGAEIGGLVASKGLAESQSLSDQI